MAQIISSLDDPSIVHLLRGGSVGVMPTDTVYGLVAVATDEKAVRRLYALKSRDNKPGTVMCASAAQAASLGIESSSIEKARRYWPNPLSIILPTNEQFAYLTIGLGTLAVRVPADQNLRSLLLQTGPLLTSSANLAGEPVARNCDEAQAYFDETVDFYVDTGALEDRPPSTVARLTESGSLDVIRPGAFDTRNMEIRS